MKIFKTKARLIKEQDERLTAVNWFNKFESSTADITPSVIADGAISLKSDGLSARFVNFGGDHSDEWTVRELFNTEIQVTKSAKLPFSKLLGFGTETGVVINECSLDSIDESAITHVERIEIDHCQISSIDLPKSKCEYMYITDCKGLEKIGHIHAGTDLILRDLPDLKEVTSINAREIRIRSCRSLTHIHNFGGSIATQYISIQAAPKLVIDHKFAESMSHVKQFTIDDKSGIKRGMEFLMLLPTQPIFRAPLSSVGYEAINQFVSEIYSKYSSGRQRMAAFIISAPEELKQKYPAVFKR